MVQPFYDENGESVFDLLCCNFGIVLAFDNIEYFEFMGFELQDVAQNCQYSGSHCVSLIIQNFYFEQR
ncbi:hypothetical protein T4D_13145 [Trichinella pseudospiralis]|uniref:Uncharacterized protein n=1 Tax=Trichinella pseudospiralis TaxID=6337 RepID=A0A0V1FGK7_TRIPS|nr:hypothetical protein T4D_13145 [Trichinella pseudospiralis]